LSRDFLIGHVAGGRTEASVTRIRHGVYGTGPRGVIGVQPDGAVLLTVLSGSLSQAAEAMRSLGAVDAMCTDGGASTGLWYEGSYIVRPGRQISNAWLVVPNTIRVCRR
jgi:exopolysaccharide biosynthesis protein